MIKKMTMLKELRIKACKTQLEVMAEIGMKSRSNYSKIENGHHKPSLKMRRALALALGVAPADISI